MNRPVLLRSLLSSFLVLVLGSASSLHAQYSDAAFTQKKAGELYDERGFYQNKAITVDGKLVVSNSNGNVSYSYPISSWQADGFGFSTSLNYCGSVAFSTHSEYSPGRIDDPYVHWSRFSQNRPVWLLGVNGFAVQALSLATAFHSQPDWLTSYANTSNTLFDDADFVWTIDGYDICNRMQDFAVGDYNEAGGGGGGSPRYVYRDVIRLLRDDGSVLELLNVNQAGDNAGISDNWEVSQGLYSGYYVVNEANHPGYARVEFTTDGQLRPWYLGFLPEAPRYTSRKVHYYPGDGLEYIFLERFNPYGMADIREPLARFGSAKANPTIFYLSEIRSAGRTLVGFTYSRHGVQYRNTGEIIWDMRGDSTMGRALLTDFDNHTITYNDGSIVISAFGRTTKVILDEVSYSGNANSAQYFPLATLGYFNGWSDALSKLPVDNGAQYKSWVGYVAKIIDPENRETTFDYGQYERRHANMGWPRAGGSPAVTTVLKNYRLKEIVEPTAKYTIKYRNRSGGPSAEPDTDDLDTLTVVGGQEGYRPFAFSNAARLVEKRTLDGTLLSTDRYDLYTTALPDAPATTPERCDVVTTDAVTGFVDSSVYSYSRVKLPRSIKYSPDKYYTQLNRVDRMVKDATDAIVQTTRTDKAYAPIAPYLWLPTEEVVSVDGAPKARALMYYLTDTVRYYGGNDTLIKYHGMELLRQVSVRRDPLYNTHVIDTTLLSNVPEFDTTFFHTDSTLDWATMRRRFDSLRNQVGDSLAKSVDFSRMLDDPRVYARKLDTIVDGAYTIPPIFGLAAESWSSDGDGNYLGGKKSIYCLLGDCDGGPATSSWFNRLLLHGAKLTDTAYGRGRIRAVAGTRPVYENANRGLPDYTENIIGGRALYDYGQPGNEGMEIGQGNLLANDGVVYDKAILSTSYLSRAFGVPQIQKTVVRSYNPSGFLVADTLTTMQELTYYGLASGVVDPNGWYSEFDYDYNGRLNTAWLPHDFQSPDSLYYFDVTDPVISVGYGSSSWRIDTFDYYCNDSAYTFYFASSYHLGTFLVNKPINIIPLCSGGHTTDSTAALDEKGASVQDIPGHLHYTVRQPSETFLTFTVQTPEVQELLSLDSAFVELTIASVVGECVTLNITIPEYSTFQKTYVLNCDELEPGTGDDTLSSTEKIRIPLGNYLDSIADDQQVTFRFATTTSGGEVRMVNWYESEDESRPRLVLHGLFRKFAHDADYTLKYNHNDSLLKSEIWAKVDDSLHSANRVFSHAAMYGESRRTKIEHHFGADYRLQKSRTYIGDPDSPARIDSIAATHTGLGAVLKATDQVGDTVSTVYDAAGRPVKSYNQDGTFSTIAYYTCGYDPDEVPDPELCDSSCYGPTPPGYCDCPVLSCFGIDPGDQDFYGFIAVKVTTNENGIKFAQYYDAFDRLRREIADSGGLHRVTKYEYDILGRMQRVINPAHDTTLYWYDNLGRVRYKQQPDLGTISYAYDDLGNPRFVQTQEQEEELRVTFNQYDDLNRLVIVGEADFYDPEEPGGGEEETSIGIGKSDIRSRLFADPSATVDFAAIKAAATDLSLDTRHLALPIPGDPEKSGHALLDVPTDDTLNLNRLTDQLDPNYLHDSGFSAILTANRTLWMPPAMYAKTVPTFWSLYQMDTVARNCATMNSLRPDAVGPFLRHPATTYEPTTTVSTVQDFENLAKYPENVRIAISYDKLPPKAGAVWGTFPVASQWHSLAPTGQVRNLKGREAAVAYREHGGEPYHYSVMSYDERGRVEALIRYTENLGFDAVYYQYNSLNQVNRLTVVDPLRRYTTWYGYDQNGRVDSVWTRLENVGSGLLNFATGVWAYNSSAINRFGISDIRYLYTKTGQVDTMWYPRIATYTAYHYSPRKWLDTMIARRLSNDIFKQYLTFDDAGQITKQMSQQGSGSWLRQDYFYDDLGQLTQWRKDSGTGYGELYTYDSVGNRLNLYNENNTGAITSWRNYDVGRRTDTSAGPNQMLKSLNRNFFLIADYTTYEYDPDGAQKRRKLYNSSGTLQLDEKFSYSSWRGLSWKYERTNPNLIGANTWEWRYRYNAMGEREQKRETLNPGGDGTASNGYNWTYYLLGGNKQQLSVWEGLQTSDATFCAHPGTGSFVHLYPSEYLTYGGLGANLLTKPTATSATTQEYRIADHLGSNRVVMSGSGGAVLSTTDYQPFGKPLSGSTPDRKSFIDKEQDVESQLGNFGVRSYDFDGGRFTSVDPLWEKFAYYAPYHYGHNAPVNRLDPDGKDDYQVDAYGYITLLKKTEDENDVLYASDEYGNVVQENSLTIRKGILNQKSKEKDEYGKDYDSYEVKGDEVATDLFKFLAKNCLVEWGQILVGVEGEKGKNYITTSHEIGSEGGGREVCDNILCNQGYTVREYRHSHPYNTAMPSGTTGLEKGTEASGDLGMHHQLVTWCTNFKPMIFSIYLPAIDTFIQFNDNGTIKNDSETE